MVDGSLFVSDAADGTKDLWITDAAGSNAVLALDCADPCREVDDPAWSPDDRSILLVRNLAATGGDGIPTVAAVELASGRVTTVLAPATTQWAVNPRWKRDGTAFVVELDRFGSSRFDDETVLDNTIGVVGLRATKPTFAPIRPVRHRGPAYPDWGLHGTIVYSLAADAQSETAVDPGP